MANIPIDALPEQITAEAGNYLVVQDGVDTKKMLVSVLNTLTDTGLTAHLADASAAHAASAVSAAPNGVLTGADVQAQLAQAAAAIDTNTTGKQPLDPDLTTIAGLTATTDNVIQSVASAWASRTPAQLKTTLALVKADVGLGSVDNTTDMNKPVSTAQAAADALKADKTIAINTTAPLAGGGDLSAARTLTISDFSTSNRGTVPASGGGGDRYLRADGIWAVLTPTIVRGVVTANTGTAYSPVLADENVMITLSNAATITVTLPSDATQAFPVGAEVDFLWLGVGQPSFVAGSGATVNATPGLKMRARYSAATAKKIAVNTWVVLGDLST
jgi:hypothetical protein